MLEDPNAQVPVQPQPSQIPPELATPSPSKPPYLPLGLAVVVLLLAFGAGGYYLGNQTANNSQQVAQPKASGTPIVQDTTSQQNTVSPTSNPSVVSSLPEGWSYKDNGKCDVKFALPPKQEPYYYPVNANRQPSVTSEQGSGRFWDFPRGGVYPNLLSKLPNWDDTNFDIQAVTMFASPEEASGYVSQAVAVSCIKNSGVFADNDALLTTLRAELTKYNSSTDEKGMQPQTYQIANVKTTKRWNKNVIELTVSEDGNQNNYTMFVTPDYIYEIKVFGATGDNFVKQTAQEIYNNLAF